MTSRLFVAREFGAFRSRLCLCAVATLRSSTLLALTCISGPARLPRFTHRSPSPACLPSWKSSELPQQPHTSSHGLLSSRSQVGFLEPFQNPPTHFTHLFSKTNSKCPVPLPGDTHPCHLCCPPEKQGPTRILLLA